jgi:hypothetical protein
MPYPCVSVHEGREHDATITPLVDSNRRPAITLDPSRQMNQADQKSCLVGMSGNAGLGRIGTRGQQMVHLFDSESEPVSLFLDVLREKRRRGYKLKRIVDIHRI